jgi:curli biogenesis system outer membrane secretion channel CsgG
VKSLRIGLSSAIAIILLAAMAATAQERPRVAVIPFDNRTDWWAQGMGEVAADMIVTRLVNSGQFTVIERERLEAILEEQGFQLSGQVNPDDIVQIGRLAGVMYMITGSVTRFSIDEIGTRVLGRNVGYTEAQSEMNVRAISTETGEIITAVEADGSKRLVNVSGVISMSAMDRGVAEDALSPAADNIVEELLDQRSRFVMIEVAAPAAPAPSIVGTGSDGSFYIDQGENRGVRVGQRFEVLRVVDEIVNAAGDVLDRITDRVGVIEVTRVLSQSAICTVVEGEAGEGDMLQAVQ